DDMGWIHLPRPRRPSVRRRRVEITARSAPRPLPAFGPLDIESTSFLVVSGTGDVERERLWNEYVERYHYLGYGVPLGPHIKYFCHCCRRADGLPFVRRRSVESGSQGSLDWLERRTTRAQSSLHREQHALRHISLGPSTQRSVTAAGAGGETNRRRLASAVRIRAV